MTHRIFNFTGCTLVLFCTFTQLSAQEASLDEVLFESSEHLRRGQTEEALSILNQHQKLYESSPEFLNNLAVAYLGNNDPEKALSVLRSIVNEDPLFSIIGHNFLEMELGAAGVKTEQVNPILFVQSADSFASGVSAPPQTGASATTEADLVLQGALRALVQSWADAWSTKDFERYIGHYAGSFEPQGGMPLDRWHSERESRLAKPGKISVTIGNLEVHSDPLFPKVEFDQIYQSTNYSDRTRKEMTFAQDNERWRILSETTIRTY